ncbi:hypothetical protein Avbf_00839 [Armadillidium vulgare]|nr:hypothetical protein Avbf_00839 [Armadillidium vulgare]
MSSQHRLLFVYSCDPPSPDVFSEHDPPIPLDLDKSPLSNNDLIYFSAIELQDKKFSGKFFDPEFISGRRTLQNESINKSICKYDAVDTKSKYSSLEKTSKDEELSDNKAVQVENMEENHSEDNGKLYCLYNNSGNENVNANPNSGELVENYMSQSSDKMNGLKYTSEEDDILNEPTSEGYTNEKKHINNHHQSTEKFSAQYIPNSLDDNRKCSRSNSLKDEISSATLSLDASETFYPTFSSDAQYISPESSSQSLSSLISDTITINEAFDSSLSTNNHSTKYIATSEEKIKSLNKHSSASSTDLGYEDSVLEPCSPIASPSLTDSCTITPFPTDHPTPNSTNPTSSPLPYDLLSYPFSESSPSTPSTITSSTMHSISKKLESLTTNAKYNDNAFNNSMIASQNRKSLNESTTCTQNINCSNNLISDNSDQNISENMVLSKGKHLDSREEISNTLAQPSELGIRNVVGSSNVDKLKKKFISNDENLVTEKGRSCDKQFSTSEKDCENNNNNNNNNNNTSGQEQSYELKMKTSKSPDKLSYGTPPQPPPRSRSSIKHLPPPLPPPPLEESEDDDAPPIPSLPLYFTTEENQIRFSPPPDPPVRQYLLIPLTPGKTTPLLLTPPPPPTPHRSSSFKITPSPSPSPPLVPNKPRQYNSVSESNIIHQSSSFNLEKSNNYNSVQSIRYFPAIRELTPVPEESSSPTRVSDEATENECKSFKEKMTYAANEKVSFENKDDKCLGLVGKKFSMSPSPPPPLPPKPPGLKLSTLFKSPPPPPPPPSRTLNSGKTNSRLNSFCVKDRSPPNDRILNYFPPECDGKEEPSSKSIISPSEPPPPPVPTTPLTKKSVTMSVSQYGKLVINRSDLPQPPPDEEVRRVLTNAKNWGWLRENVDTLAIYTQLRPIIQQGPIYDAEPNHVPGFKNGRKAHWGLLCGCLIQNKGLHFRHETTPFKADSKTDHLWHLRPTPQMFNIDRSSSVPPSKASPKQSIRASRSVSPYHSLGEESTLERLAKRLGYTTQHQNIKEDFTVIGLFRQGKSRNLIYVPLVDICNSNSQLYEYPDTEGYVIDSVEKGLCGQVVILQKEIHGLSDLLGTLQE